jgi:hypothetical protein
MKYGGTGSWSHRVVEEVKSYTAAAEGPAVLAFYCHGEGGLRSAMESCRRCASIIKHVKLLLFHAGKQDGAFEARHRLASGSDRIRCGCATETQ